MEIVSDVKKFICKSCIFSSNRIGDWKRHIITKKHCKRILLQLPLQICQTVNCHNDNVNCQKEKYICETCEKKYVSRNGLWKHKKKCLPKDKQLIMLLMKENHELKNMMMDVIKNCNSTNTPINNNISLNNNTSITNTSITNTHNKSFNLTFFLNETCKDAMNIMEFVESIKLQLSDLENVGKVGFVNGITNIIVKNLNALNETQRPVHCTDKKREVIYVKDEDKWEKEGVEYKKIRKAIKCIAKKNSKLLFEFKEKYPECLNGESKCSDKYTKLVIEAYGGSNQEDADNENKIIKNISKTIAIDKLVL